MLSKLLFKPHIVAKAFGLTFNTFDHLNVLLMPAMNLNVNVNVLV